MADQVREKELLAMAGDRTEENRKAGAAVRVFDAAGRPVAGCRVAARQTAHEFLFGSNILQFDRLGEGRDDIYKRRFAELFNYGTTGFYWAGYEPREGKPDYESTDRIVGWAREHGVRLKGHPIFWDTQYGNPSWAGGPPSKERQRKRVFDLLRRFKGNIPIWEVVNEPAHHPVPVTIEEPYRWAREADPESYLIINDYDVLGYILGDGYPAFLELLRLAIGEGVPFDGIGIQAHNPRTDRFELDHVWDVFDRYAALGKDLHVTEFTPASDGREITGSHVKGVWDEAAQADYAEKFYRVSFAHPAMAAITWWDFCDKGAWREGGGMLREDMSPKPVFEAVRRLIHEEWRTDAEGKSDKEGVFKFRGFRGEYRVEARRGEKSAEARLRVAKGEENRLTVTLG